MLVAVATSSRLTTLSVNMRIRTARGSDRVGGPRLVNHEARECGGETSANIPFRPAPTNRAARSSSSMVSMMVSAIRSAAPT
jgi:hypothetical protein